MKSILTNNRWLDPSQKKSQNQTVISVADQIKTKRRDSSQMKSLITNHRRRYPSPKIKRDHETKRWDPSQSEGSTLTCGRPFHNQGQGRRRGPMLRDNNQHQTSASDKWVTEMLVRVTAWKNAYDRDRNNSRKFVIYQPFKITDMLYTVLGSESIIFTIFKIF